MTLQEKLNAIQHTCNTMPKRVTEFEKGQIVYSAGRSYRVTSFDGEILRVTRIEDKTNITLRKQPNDSFIIKAVAYKNSNFYVFDKTVENAKIRLDKGTKAYEMVKLNRELEILTNKIDELYTKVDLAYGPIEQNDI